MATRIPPKVNEMKKAIATILSRSDGRYRCAYMTGSTRLDGTHEPPQKCRDHGCLGSFNVEPKVEELRCFVMLDNPVKEKKENQGLQQSQPSSKHMHSGS